MHSSITTTLGLNLTSFILYGLAFLITVAALARFVWPPLTRVLDAKVEELERASTLQTEAETRLKAAETEASATVRKAQHEAEAILANARTSAQSIMSEAELKAHEQAERIAADGERKLAHERTQARTSLRGEAARLVAIATSNLLGEKITPQSDGKLIDHALDRAEGRS